MGIFRRLIPTAAQEPFIITVQVPAGGTFTLPLVSYGPSAPNFTVDWGDGTVADITSVTDTARIHTYASGYTGEIIMQGFIPGWSVNNDSTIRSWITGIVDFGRTGMGKMNFFGCNNLTSIPTSAQMIANGGTDEDGDGNRDGNGIGYPGLASVRDFSTFMRSTGLGTIPEGLFDFATRAIDFSDAFSITPITYIPNGLFDENTTVQTFASTFGSCINLVAVPVSLFANNTAVLTFSGTFRNCINITTDEELNVAGYGIINSGIIQFTQNTVVTIFDRVYSMFTTSNSITGTAPALWTRTPRPSGTDAFNNCTALTNFAAIPADFK